MTGPVRSLDFGPIRDALTELGVPQTDYALALDVTPKHVCQVLNGRASPTVRLLVEMARQVGLEWRLVPASAPAEPRRPHVSVDPQMRSGRPCVNGTRIPAEALAGYVAAGDDVGFVAEQYNLTREAVLVACWYQATYGKGRWRKRWGEWAEDSHSAMWHGLWADVDDPPEWPKRSRK